VERFHRYYALHQLLKGRRVPVARAVIQEKLECSRATVSRIIEDLRGYGAPIEYLRNENGYRYTPGSAYELPGVWFNASELYALLAAQKLLADAEPGLLDEARLWTTGAIGLRWATSSSPQAFEVLIPCAHTVQNTMAAVKSAHAKIPTG